MGLVYGIDFGTSNSAIMVGRPGGRVTRIGNPVESSAEIPTVVCMRPDGTMAVGSIARRMKLQRPAWFRDEFKREVGRETPVTFPPERRGESFSARSFPVYRLVAEVLKTLRLQAEKEVPGHPDVTVITVPASWEAVSRGQILQAAAYAGFDPPSVHLVTEPEAAAAYAVQEHLGLEQRTLLIYDLGGGTFDCAVVRGKGPLGFEVMGEPGGRDNVGGALFDRRILALICERFPVETSRILDAAEPDNTVMAQRLQLRDTCENAKRVLSAEELYEGWLTELGPDIEFVMSRSELAGIVDPILAETLAECEHLLSSVNLTWGDIDGVIPIGGSTRLPMVGTAIARRCAPAGTSVMRVDDPELAVVHGAVLYGLALQRADVDWAAPAATAADESQAAPTQGRPLTASTPPELREPSPAAAPPLGDNWSQPAATPAATGPVFVPRPTASTPETTAAGVPGTTARDASEASLPRAQLRLTRPRGPANSDSATPSAPRTQSFHAKNTEQLRSVHRVSIYGLCLAAAAGVLAILNIFDVVSGTNLHKGVTRGELTLSACVLALAAAVVFASSARTLYRRVLPGVGSELTLGVAIVAMVGVHFVLHGWPGTVLVVLLGITGGVSFFFIFVAADSFVTSLTMDSSGMTFYFNGLRTVRITWSEMESITVPGGSRIVSAKLTNAAKSRSRRPLNFDVDRNYLKLFGRYHFTESEQELHKSINSYSGRKLVS